MNFLTLGSCWDSFVCPSSQQKGKAVVAAATAAAWGINKWEPGTWYDMCREGIIRLTADSSKGIKRQVSLRCCKVYLYDLQRDGRQLVGAGMDMVLSRYKGIKQLQGCFTSSVLANTRFLKRKKQKEERHSDILTDIPKQYVKQRGKYGCLIRITATEFQQSQSVSSPQAIEAPWTQQNGRVYQIAAWPLVKWLCRTPCKWDASVGHLADAGAMPGGTSEKSRGSQELL